MSKLIPGNHKHLTPYDRQFIEQSLNEGRSFREISRYLCKDPSTISREVWKHRTVNSWNRGCFNNPYNFCIHRYRCKKTNACSKLIICDTLCRSCHKCNSVCPRFERECCPRIEKAPFVCNGCDKPRNRCPIHTKYDYNASSAHRHYTECLSSSREGVNLTDGQWRSIDRVVRPLIEQGQSPYMIIANHPELGRTSIYYCDPMRSSQKAGIENVHTMLRMILPKGTMFAWLTQWDVRKCVDHINNAPRKCLKGRTPYEIAIKTYGPELLKKLQLRFVAPDEVTLSPKLLRN